MLLLLCSFFPMSFTQKAGMSIRAYENKKIKAKNKKSQ
jgi:hypothetical protein